MSAVKLIGLALLFSACTAAGFSRAAALDRRARILRKTSSCLSELGERIRCDGAERGRLLNEIFGGTGILSLSGRSVVLHDCGFSAEDKRLLNDFFDRLGTGGGELEYNRVQLTLTLLSRQQQQADRRAAELSHICRTAGLCAGLAGCLLFL